MTTLDVILDDIRAAPDDDLPRLALADWCLEQDDPATQARGEFVHLRMRAASLPLGDAGRLADEVRAKRLEEEFGEAWAEGLADHVERCHFERGMILLELSPTRGLRRRKNQSAADPLGHLAAVAGWRWVIGVRGVSLEVADVRRLVRSEQFARLTSFDLSDCPLTPAGASALAKAPAMRHLTALNLSYAELGDAGLAALATSPHLDRLNRLVLANNGVGPAGVRELGASLGFESLTSLDLSRNPIGDDGLRRLGEASGLTGVRRLRLTGCGIREAAPLAMLSRFEALEEVDLADNPLTRGSRGELRERFGERVKL